MSQNATVLGEENRENDHHSGAGTVSLSGAGVFQALSNLFGLRHELRTSVGATNTKWFLYDLFRAPFFYARWLNRTNATLRMSEPRSVFLKMVMRPARRYLRRWFTRRDTAAILAHHYETVDNQLSDAAIRMMREPGGWRVATLNGRSERAYHLILQGEPTKEGEFTLTFRAADTQTMLYCLRGSIGPSAGRAGVLWIGALQGPNNDSAREDMVAATKDLHHMRPKQMVFHATAALCLAFGVTLAYAPGNLAHLSYRWWHKRRRVRGDLDAFWKEYAPEANAKGDYEIAFPLPRRQADEVPGKKRKEWLARHALIDRAAEQIGASIRAETLHPASESTPQRVLEGTA